MEPAAVRLNGRVVRETVAQGSKSEREAVALKTPDGLTYVLRRQGGPAFGADDTLDSLVGRSIDASGIAADSTLILRDWTLVD